MFPKTVTITGTFSRVTGNWLDTVDFEPPQPND